MTGKPAFFPERIPMELRQEPRWVCWCLEERGGRRTKVPKDAKNGQNASSTDPRTWSTFDVAAAAALGPGRYAGVGFVFGPDHAYTGLDLDHVLAADGTVAERYRWIVEEAATYTEVSPSGDGLHLFFRGRKPEGALKCRKNQEEGRVVEMYDHDRFFTVTGNAYTGVTPAPPVEVRENPDLIARAYETFIDPKAKEKRAQAALGPAQGVTGLDDDELIRRMLDSRNGQQIRELMDGSTASYGGDDSAADLALCNHLAFWCAGDLSQMDRIFRRSGLMRDKWDTSRGGTTYGQQTMEKAVAGATEFYKPRRGKGRPTRRERNERSTDAVPEPTGDEDGAPSIEGWHVDDRGRLWVMTTSGELRYSVTSTPPYIAADLVDLDTERVRALVRMQTGRHTCERAFDREVLLNQNKIVGALAPLGANVTSANAKDVVRYLTDCEKRLGASRPRLKSVTHMGWADGPLGSFMPYDAGGDVRFDPTPDEALKARPFAEPKGTLDGWRAGVAPVRAKSPAFRALMAASFASPLVALLSVQTFIVYLWGNSRSGKTPTLKAAGSVWGDPTEGSNSYFRTFADTPKSIVKAAALLHDVPVIVDELQAKGSAGGQSGKRQYVEDLLYSLSLGHERGALNSDRTMMHAGSWHSLTIATGEIPIVGDATQQGAANRTLEINAEPFAEPREAQAMHHLVADEHGTAGRHFVACLRGNDAAFYAGEFRRMRDAIADVAQGHPQADNIALLAFADALSEFYVFSPGGPWDACVAGSMGLARWLLDHSTGREGGDTDLKAIQYVSEWLVRNKLHFDSTAEMDRMERYGILVEHSNRPGFDWYVFSSVLSEALDRANFDRQKTLRRMADEGIVICGGHGYTVQRRIGTGVRMYCVCIDNEVLTQFLSSPTPLAGASSLEPAMQDGG